MIKTWRQRCEGHPDHNGIVSEGMIHTRMQEEIDELRAALERAQPYKRLYELRGKALERPCINCGHQPAKIKTMAQPEQHEQAMMDAIIGGTGVMLGDKRIDPASIYRQPEQEPVAWYVRFDNGRVDLLAVPVSSARRAMWESAGKRFTVTPLYIAPRQWQRLTDDEIDRVTDQQWATNNNKPIYAAHKAYARAIEAKLKEKNNAR